MSDHFSVNMIYISKKIILDKMMTALQQDLGDFYLRTALF